MSKYFLSFGNKKFISSRNRIKKEAENLNLFDKITIEDENICNEEIFINILKKINKPNLSLYRGFGWYIWKPYIIYKQLLSMKNDDILLYCDAGMTLLQNKQKYLHLFDLVNDTQKCPSGIATFITTGPKEERLEYMYNLVQIFKYFNIENDKDITHTQQCQAGIIIIKKCQQSIKIIKEWFDISNTNPEYFIGDPRFCYMDKTIKQIQGFKDHRHDQSVWSVLSKINNVNILPHNLNPIYQSHIRE